MIRMSTRICQIYDGRSRFAQNKNIIHHIVTKIEYDNMEKKKVIIWCFIIFAWVKKKEESTDVTLEKVPWNLPFKRMIDYKHSVMNIMYIKSYRRKHFTYIAWQSMPSHNFFITSSSLSYWYECFDFLM